MLINFFSYKTKKINIINNKKIIFKNHKLAFNVLLINIIIMIIKKKYNSHLSRVIKFCFFHSYINIKPGLSLSSILKKKSISSYNVYIFLPYILIF